MAKVSVTTRAGELLEIDCRDGESLMEGLRAAGVDELLAICGGNLSCATCHVYVAAEDFARLEAVAQEEKDLIESTGLRKETSRLSCQIVLAPPLGGLKVTIAPEP